MGPKPAHDLPSIEGLRHLLIPAVEASRWDDGELPQAVLNLDNQTVLARCDVLVRLAVVESRSLDGTRAARAVALREVILELLPKDFDHPFCSVLRALAGLEQGTAGRRREQRQEIAGRALGPDRYPIHPRSVRRRVREDCWPWLLDRLIEQEVRERRAAEVERTDAALPTPAEPLVLTPAMIAPWTPRRGIELLLRSDAAALLTDSEDDFESVLDVARRMRWLGCVCVGDDGLDLLDAAVEDVVARYEAGGPVRLAPEAICITPPRPRAAPVPSAPSATPEGVRSCRPPVCPPRVHGRKPR
jgi:hypothetical protein